MSEVVSSYNKSLQLYLHNALKKSIQDKFFNLPSAYLPI